MKNSDVQNIWTKYGFTSQDEANPDDKVWHYMDFSQFISVLDKRSLFFSRLDQFNDKWEGYIPEYISSNNLTEDQLNLAQKITENLFSFSESINIYSYIYNNFSFFYNKEELHNLILELFSLIKQNDRKKVLKVIKEKIIIKGNNSYIESARKCALASCWHINNTESEAMWKLYSSINEGIAIQSTVARLNKNLTGLNKFSENNKYEIEFRKVIYRDAHKLPDLTIEDNFIPRFFIKRPSLIHENEFRVLVASKPENNSCFRKEGDYIKADLNELIEKIYISPLSSKWFINGELVKSALQRYRFPNLTDKVFPSNLKNLPANN